MKKKGPRCIRPLRTTYYTSPYHRQIYYTSNTPDPRASKQLYRRCCHSQVHTTWLANAVEAENLTTPH